MGGRHRCRGRPAVPGLPVSVPAGRGRFGRRVDRAAGLGPAARPPAAVRLDRLGRVLLPHRAAAVRPDRGGARAQPRRRARSRGDDLPPGPAAGRVAGERQRPRPRRPRAPAGGGLHHAGPGRRGRLHAADEPRSLRQRGARAAGLAGRRPAAGCCGPGPLVPAGRGRPAADLGPGLRQPDPGHRRRPDRGRGRVPGRSAVLASGGPAAAATPGWRRPRSSRPGWPGRSWR